MCAVPGLTRRRFRWRCRRGPDGAGFGSVLILVSFGLAQLQTMSTQSRPYLMLNLAGSTILAATATVGAQ
jgi:hypothetical protein